MSKPSIPIRRQLMRMVLLTSLAVLLLTTSAFVTYEMLTFRQASEQQLRILGEAIAANTSAALAFDNPEDAQSVLSAFAADPNISLAVLFDEKGLPFATYPADGTPPALPDVTTSAAGYQLRGVELSGFQPVVENERRLGTLYIQSDLDVIGARLRLYGLIVAVVIAASVLLAYGLSRRLQHHISQPILALSDAASAVSDQKDYSIRVPPAETYEVDRLTEAFNHMLSEVQQSEGRLKTQLSHLELLQHITHAIADRQDLESIFHVVLRSLEDNLAVDVSLVCRYDSTAATFVIANIGPGSRDSCESLDLEEGRVFDAGAGHLAKRTEGGTLDSSSLSLITVLEEAGYKSVVAAPMSVDRTLVGILLVARRQSHSFSASEHGFLTQLSTHVALAAQQANLYGALQQAYEDLRQTQQAVLQQERLRVLGQMASGIAHDINNAISPVSLYTGSLLEREPNLSDRARSYLMTIQRAIDDVASTVARLREFYRAREPQVSLARVDMNRLVRETIELTRPRWSDLPQQGGQVIEVKEELCGEAADVMAAEGEIRDALTNLVFNALDAMPKGGTLTLRTVIRRSADPSTARLVIEVADTGMGMDEATRTRCLEPFFTTKGERGTGLGLAMVYGTVQRHSAEIEIDSALNVGTTFKLSFPLASTNAVADMQASNAEYVVEPLRILVIDDDPLLAEALEVILCADGHYIAVENGGQSGIERFKAALHTPQSFQLVMTDLGMPYVDGRKVAAAVKTLSPSTPVLLLTGWGQRMVADQEIPPYVDKVLGKPPKVGDLRKALQELLQRPAAHAPAAHGVVA